MLFANYLFPDLTPFLEKSEKPFCVEVTMLITYQLLITVLAIFFSLTNQQLLFLFFQQNSSVCCESEKQLLDIKIEATHKGRTEFLHFMHTDSCTALQTAFSVFTCAISFFLYNFLPCFQFFVHFFVCKAAGLRYPMQILFFPHAVSLAHCLCCLVLLWILCA